MVVYAVKIDDRITYAFTAGLIEQYLTDQELSGHEHVSALAVVPRYDDLVDFITELDFAEISATTDSGAEIKLSYPLCDRAGLAWQLGICSRTDAQYGVITSNGSLILLTPAEAALLHNSLTAAGSTAEISWLDIHAEQLKSYYNTKYTRAYKTYGRA